MSSISVTVVADAEEKLNVIAHYFGLRCLDFEILCFGYFEALSSGSDRPTLWDYCELSSEAFYMKPSGEVDEEVTIEVCGNQYQGSMSMDAAGVVVSIFSLNHLCAISKDQRYIDLYYKLMDFADLHPESSKIFRAID